MSISIKRDALAALSAWHASRVRKPLLIRGARQVGKSTLVRLFAAEKKLNLVEINFEQKPRFKGIFEQDLDAVRVSAEIEALTQSNLKASDAVLFFDEIQECPKAIQALRYFYEQLPNLAVLASGSLLEFALEEIGLPVGRIELLYVYPLSFLEFITNFGKSNLEEYVTCFNPWSPPSQTIHNELLELLSLFTVIGGMPEAAASYIEKRDFNAVAQIHTQIVNTLRQDFHKYARKNQVPFVEDVFNTVPRYIGQKFKYVFVDREKKAVTVSKALDLLVFAGIVYKAFHTYANGVPLGAEINRAMFKAFFFDGGLAQHVCQLNLAEWLPAKRSHLSNRGLVAEQVVANELVSLSPPSGPAQLYYWHREKTGSRAEVDFVISINAQIIPIEVKAGNIRSSKSLHLFLKQKKHSNWVVEFSSEIGIPRNNILYLPLYAIAALPGIFERIL